MDAADAAGPAAVDRRGGARPRRHRGAARRAARRRCWRGFAREVEREVGVTVSIGLAANRLLAKIAADRDKPRGFAVIGAEEAASLLAPEPVAAAARHRPRARAAAGGPGHHPARPPAGARASATRCAGWARMARRWSARARGEDARRVDPGARDEIDQRRNDLRRRSDAMPSDLERHLWRLSREAGAAAEGEGPRGRRRRAEAEDRRLSRRAPARPAARARRFCRTCCSRRPAGCSRARRTGPRSA